MTAMYTMRRGGAYDRFIMMIEAFLERGCEVHCLSLTSMPIKNPLFYNHLVYFPFIKVSGSIAKLLVISIFPLWSTLVGWRNKIDLIIAFGPLYAFIQIIPKWSLRKPMVTLVRSSPEFYFEMQGKTKLFQFLNKYIENIGLLFSNRIITNNKATRDNILKYIGKRKNLDVQILYNNIPSFDFFKINYTLEDRYSYRKKYGIPQDSKLIITAGILNQRKNIEILIRALPNIETKNVFLLIAGDGKTEDDLRYKDSLKRLVKKLGVDDKVIFTGWLKKGDLWKIFQSSDLFILPSLKEGMPNALLEALGCDLLCLGSDIAGVKDILQYEELMFNPLDKDNIVEKINCIFLNKEFFKRLKSLCDERKKFFLFDWKKEVFQLVKKGTLKNHTEPQ